MDSWLCYLSVLWLITQTFLYACQKHRNVGVLSVLPVQSHLLHYITSNELHDIFLLVTHSSISTELTAKFQLNSPQKNDVATLMLLGGRSFTVTILKDCAYHCSNFYFILPPTWTETRQLCIKRRAGKCCIYFFICYASVWLATAITKYSRYIAFIHQYMPHWKLLRQLGGRWQQSYVSHISDEARWAEAANSFRLSKLSFLPSLVSMNSHSVKEVNFNSRGWCFLTWRGLKSQ